MEQIRILEKLLTVAKGPIPYIKVLMALISSRYDYNPSMSSHMSVEMWKSTLGELNTLVGLLESNPDVTISEEIEEEEEDEEKENQRPEDDSGSKVIRGSFVSFISRLDREFLMSLQNTDPHTVEYIERLKDETPLYGIIKRSEQYFAHCNDIESVCRLKMMRVEHIYYKVCG
jgi:translation initiation factor 3 subunit C